MKEFLFFLFYMITDREAGGNYYEVEEFIRRSSKIMLIVAFVALLALILTNTNLRKRRRTEDKIMFWECVIIMVAIALDYIYRCQYELFGRYYIGISVYVPPVKDILYMLAILQWVIFVDYSLFHSMEHIRMRYKYSALPAFIIIIVNIIQNNYIYTSGDEGELMRLFHDITHFTKLAIELGYMFVALYISYVYGKEHNEPKFLRLKAFIIPFALGCLVRKYDLPLMTLGIILTYFTIKKRDRYIDSETGFYNRDFLTYVSRFRDRNKYIDDNGVLISAKGHGKDMAELLEEIRPADGTYYALGDDRFLILSESLRESAMKITVMTITEAAEASEDSYTPQITTASRREGESAVEFTERMLNQSAA